jgi:hypothetical protein
MTKALPVRRNATALRRNGTWRLRGSVAGWFVVLATIAGCAPADSGSPRPAAESSAIEASGSTDVNPATARGDTAAASSGNGRAQGPTTTVPITREEAPEQACAPPRGPLAADASLAGRAGVYLLTMIEEVGGNPSRTADGTLSLLTQEDGLRQFPGGAGGSIPGVTSPLFGSTDLDIGAVGAVRVGDLSSEDPASPGVLVIESETGAGTSILLRLGSDANRRDLVRFDGGYTVLTVVEITGAAFGGTWSSGIRGPESSGFFCAALDR